jgi:hypothetical protein
MIIDELGKVIHHLSHFTSTKYRNGANAHTLHNKTKEKTQWRARAHVTQPKATCNDNKILKSKTQHQNHSAHKPFPSFTAPLHPSPPNCGVSLYS